ncbi:MAG: hypothetical protein IJO76_02815 [Clostridia bacterium]|nr:hypothetical protein [Clostridia bacterium]
MKNKHKILIRVSLFSIITVLMFCFLNIFFQPVWTTWNNYNTTYGFYEEPENTIETAFFGASVVISGISPTHLYEKYGICAYNFATEQQPMLATYYWLEEVYRLHSETLKTVVLDVSELRDDSSEAFYHKALDAMRFSDVKFRAIQDYKGGDLLDTLSYLLPLNSYHDRWSELEKTDFEKFTYDANSGTRGYYSDKRTYSEIAAQSNITLLNPVLDETAKEGKLLKSSLKYLDKMVTFCNEKNIKLVLIKTVSGNWSSSFHNAVAKVAEEYGLEFLDFNFDPLYDAYGYIHPYDSIDGKHLNWFGATKFTGWLGQYLVDHCGATDVRNNEKYAFMEEELREYKLTVGQSVQLHTVESVEEYMKLALSGNNTVFITVCDEASTGFTDELRTYLSDIGMHKLSRIGYRNGYIGIVSNEGVIYEMLKTKGDKEPLKYTGKLADGVKFTLKSGGHDQGRMASCLIDGEQWAYNKRGLNIAVYNNDAGKVVHRAVFDTYTSLTRECYSIELSEAILAAGEDVTYDEDSIEANILAYQKKVEKKRVG